MYPDGPNIEKLVLLLLKHANECMRVPGAVVCTIPCKLLCPYRIAFSCFHLFYPYQLVRKASKWNFSPMCVVGSFRLCHFYTLTGFLVLFYQDACICILLLTARALTAKEASQKCLKLSKTTIKCNANFTVEQKTNINKITMFCHFTKSK